MSVRIPLVALGARVRVRRGTLPIDAALVGRTGTVVGSSPYHPLHVDVSLDGSGEVRQFSAAELEVQETFALPEDRRSASRRRALP
ncbi:MAG: hypothetical protein ACRELV_11745 [Longimicrobiales bacterium]